MILAAPTLRKYGPRLIEPFCERTEWESPTGAKYTYGLGPAGYDVRLVLEGDRLNRDLNPGDFLLAATMERFSMPTDVIGMVHDKSSLARRGVAVQNTVIEPGWCGFLTLEITNHGFQRVLLTKGMPIAQIVFHALSEPTDIAYDGKYQNQEWGPQGPR